MLNPAKGNPKLFTPPNEAIKFRSGNPEMLPTRFRNPGYHALGGELAKRNSGQPKTTDEPTSATTLLTAIYESSRTGIPRKLSKAFVVVFGLQSGANGGVLFYRFLLPFIPFNPRLLCHKESGH